MDQAKLAEEVRASAERRAAVETDLEELYALYPQP